jgi:hypothetical protein
MRHRRQVALIFGVSIAIGVAIGLSGPGIMRAFSVGMLVMFVYLLASSFANPYDGQGPIFQQLALLRRANRYLLAGLIAGALPGATGIEDSLVEASSILLTFAFLGGAIVYLVRVRRLQKSNAQ